MFKHICSSLPLSLLLALTSLNADAARAQVPSRNKAILQQFVSLSAQRGTVDDFLLDVARSQNLNLLIDSTHISVTESEQQTIEKRLLHTVFTDFAGLYQLAALRTGEKTFLFWKRPNLNQLALQLLKREQQQVMEATPIERAIGVAGATELELQFSHTLQRIQEDPKLSEALSTGLRIGNLPHALRTPFIAWIQQALLNSLRSRLSVESAWFTDDFFEQARIQIESKRVDEFPHPRLMVGFPVQKRGGTGVTLTLARLDAPLDTYLNGNEAAPAILPPKDPLEKPIDIPPPT